MGEFPSKKSQFKPGHVGFHKKDSPQAREQVKRAGQVKSFRKSISSRMNLIKKKKELSKSDLDWITQCMFHPEANLFDLKTKIASLAEHLKPQQQIALLNTEVAIHKLLFGERKHITSENVHHVIDWGEVLSRCVKSDE